MGDQGVKESIGTCGFDCWVAEVVEAVEGMIPESLVEQLCVHQIPKCTIWRTLFTARPYRLGLPAPLYWTVFAPVVARLTKTTGL